MIILKYKEGFTLIELILVIALIGILAVLIVPNVIKTLNKADQKLLKILEQQVEDAADMYIEDYCRNPISDSYDCDLTTTDNDTFSGTLDLDILVSLGYLNEVSIRNTNK